MKKILISACLAGENCRYDGGNNLIDDSEFLELLEGFEIVKTCPEYEGGLPIPRLTSEIRGERIVNSEGLDVTNEFLCGADISVLHAKENDCFICIMKESSPSCGVHRIYDGTFSGVKIPGMGCASRKLKEAGYDVYSEKDLEKIKEVLREEIG